ncbi:MAG: hypothetical protein ACREDU_11765, partial [Methylocella sp.]
LDAIAVDPQCEFHEAGRFASELRRSFPGNRGDLTVFASAIAAMFVLTSRSIVKRVSDKSAGLPATIEFLSIKAVRDALDRELTRRDRIRAAALTTLQEHERRMLGRDGDPEDTPEQKAATVARWQEARKEIDSCAKSMRLDLILRKSRDVIHAREQTIESAQDGALSSEAPHG